MISPRMSSTIAAPSTTFAAPPQRRPRSASTRAVMPTLVAVNVALTKAARSARVAEPRHGTVADGKRHRHADEGDERGLRAGQQQLAEIGLQADLK